MMSKDEIQRLVDEMYNSSDPMEIAETLARNADRGLSWGWARLELAKYMLGQWKYESAICYAREVVEGDGELVDQESRGIAGVVLCDALESLDRDVNEALLSDSIAVCDSVGELGWAAAGRMIVARRFIAAGERAQGKAMFREAAEVYNRGLKPVGGPEALLTLAKLEIQDGRYAEADRAISDAIAHLHKIPLRMTGSRILEKRLLALRATIPVR